MITIQNLSKVYKSKHNQVVAVDDIDLKIHKGEIFGVIGYSGAGKSTFIRLINRLEDPTQGDVVLNDKNITKLKTGQLRKERQKIGMIFQHFNLLWSRTVLKNITFSLEIAGVPRKQRKEKALELIDLVGLKGRENHYPSQLSGGQKQRVGIARALANDPEVLLCDEATSALDPKTTEDILDLLVSINNKLGLTIILITHEMHVIQRICDSVAVMENGEIVEQGHTLDVFTAPKHPTTQKFVNSIFNFQLTGDIVKSLRKTGDIVALKFIDQSSEEPVLAVVAKKFDVYPNILSGMITQVKNEPFGRLLVHFKGETGEIQRALHFLRNQGIQTDEVIRYEDNKRIS